MKPYQTKSYVIYMYEDNLALNNLQWLIGHKTNQTSNTSSSSSTCHAACMDIPNRLS